MSLEISEILSPKTTDFLLNLRMFSQTNLLYLLHMHLALKNSHFPVILNFEQIWKLNSNHLHFDLDYQKVRNVSSSQKWWIEWILMVFETFLKHSNGIRSEKPPRFEPPHLFLIYLRDILAWPAISINTKKCKNVYFSRFLNLCMSQKGFQTDESWDGRFLAMPHAWSQVIACNCPILANDSFQ